MAKAKLSRAEHTAAKVAKVKQLLSDDKRLTVTAACNLVPIAFKTYKNHTEGSSTTPATSKPAWQKEITSDTPDWEVLQLSSELEGATAELQTQLDADKAQAERNFTEACTAIVDKQKAIKPRLTAIGKKLAPKK